MTPSKPARSLQESPDFGPFAMSDEPAMVMEFSPLSYEQAKGGRRRKINRHRSLGTLGVVAIAFFYGGGGPLGSESLVYAGGPLVGMIAVIVYPLVMVLPYAWIIAELCSAFPEDGGFTIWILHAFGPFWACQVGYWSWLSSTIASALVPTMFTDFVWPLIGLGIMAYWKRYLVRIAFATLMTIPSVLGTKCVSRLSITFLVMALVPYLVFTVWAYAQSHDSGQLLDVRHGNSASSSADGPISIDWKTLLNTLFWNYNGINIASVFAGEVQNPSYVYSRAILITVVLSVATVAIPIPAAVMGGDLPWWQFQEGSYAQIARHVGGLFVQVLVIISAICTAVGVYISGSYCQAFELSGMADSDLVPHVLATRNKRFRSPHKAILASWIVIVLLSAFQFGQLLPICNILACAVEMLILLAAIRLRYTLPFIPRPAKAPGGVPALVTVALCASGVLVFLSYTALDNSVQVLVVLGGLAPGLLYGCYDKYLRMQQASRS